MNTVYKKSSAEIAESINGMEKVGNSNNTVNFPTLLNSEADVRAISSIAPEDQEEIIAAIKTGKYCASFNYSDIGLPCLRASGKRSGCVWASGWGWVYFNDYEVWCAGVTLTVCYSSRGSCA